MSTMFYCCLNSNNSPILQSVYSKIEKKNFSFLCVCVCVKCHMNRVINLRLEITMVKKKRRFKHLYSSYTLFCLQLKCKFTFIDPSGKYLSIWYFFCYIFKNFINDNVYNKLFVSQNLIMHIQILQQVQKKIEKKEVFLYVCIFVTSQMNRVINLISLKTWVLNQLKDRMFLNRLYTLNMVVVNGSSQHRIILILC